MANPVVHWEIGAKDRRRIQHFLHELFGWEATEAPGMEYGTVNSGPGGINGGVWQTEPGVPDYLTFYVHVDDLQAYLNKAEQLGGKVVLPPMVIPGVGSYAMFRDPEGHMIGLFKK